MMRKLFLFTSIAVIVFTFRLEGQISPPVFQCVKGDTLIWMPVTNSCGVFQSLDIFTSSVRGGPYNLLASIPDHSTSEYVDEMQSGTAFYFLQYQYDCPGQENFTSDTLDNRSPAVTKIRRVSVENQSVRIDWNDNGSPETIGYIIYRSTDVGTIPIDTVFNELTYLDSDANPDAGKEFYYVLALDACGNTSVFDDTPHGTVFLRTEVDFCAQHIRLEWEPYTGWSSPEENYQIWLGLNGDSIEYLHQVSGSDTMAYITGVIANQEHCIRIRAQKSGEAVQSFSNTVCVIPDVLMPVSGLRIDNVSIDASGAVSIDWTYSSGSDVEIVEVEKAGDAVSWTLHPDSYNSPPSSDKNDFIDNSSNVGENQCFYRIKVLDECDSVLTSNTMSTIGLRLESSQGSTNQLSWTPLEISDRDVLDYILCRKDPSGQEVQIADFPLPVFQYTDIIDPGSGLTEVCYLIKGRHIHPQTGDTLISLSNEVCTQQDITLYIPNAFVPNGTNSIFKPEIITPEAIRSYNLNIFNRWGGKVFESSSPDYGWDGYFNGDLLAPDVYIYSIEIEQTGGKTSTRSGTINLIN